MSSLKHLTLLLVRGRTCRSAISSITRARLEKNYTTMTFKTNRLIQQASLCTSASPEMTTEPPIPEPYTSEHDIIYPDKIHNIVSEISKLTLLEVADLNDLLKKTLNIKDAPMMAMGAMPVAAPEDDEEAVPKKEKTAFNVKLMKFDDTKKIQLIKQIKGLIEGMNLVQAKKFVESAPQVVRSDLGKDEAEALKAQLEEAGASVELE